MKAFVFEKPYSDSKPIKKGWVGRFDLEQCRFDLDFQILGHSKNWSMNSLNVDLIFFSLDLFFFSLFFAYRLTIYPPHSREIKQEKVK